MLKRQAGRFVLDRLISESSPTQRTTWRFVYTPIEGRLLPEKVFYVIETRHDGAWTPWVRHYVELRHQPDHGAVESHQVRAGKDVSNPDSGVLYRVREDGSFEVVETPVATPAPAAR